MSKETLFDRRVIARNIKHGATSRKEFEQHLASLPDATGKAVPMFSAPPAPAPADEAIEDDEAEDEEEDEEEQGA